MRPLRSRRALLLACVVAGLLGLPVGAAAQEPIDDYYPDQVKPGGWLERMGWTWDDVEGAHYEDVAYPTIAVIDSGIDASNPEFSDDGVIDPASADCRSGKPRVANDNLGRVADVGAHGTIVAGLAAAPANGVGIVGASPFSTILTMRINPDGLNGLACALDYLAQQMDEGTIGLLVVNLSLFDPRPPSAAVRRGIAKLVRRGALLVAATGNRGSGSGTRVGYPARLPHVLAIGDGERQALLPGPELDLLAPGGSLSAPIGSSFGTPSASPQTSWATALASGAAAAVWGAHPDGSAMTAQQLGWLLRSTAKQAKSWTRTRGFGMIDVGAAIRQTNKIPLDDESEPNDSASDTRGERAPDPLACLKACTRRGILGTTDDREDWWAVRVPPGRKVCRVVGGAGVRSSVVQGPRGISYVRVTTNRTTAAYTLKVRAGRRC